LSRCWLARRYPDLGDMRVLVDALLDAISNTLAAGGRVEVSEFESFNLASVPGRRGRNPSKGEHLDVLAQHRMRFKSGKLLCKRLDHQG